MQPEVRLTETEKAVVQVVYTRKSGDRYIQKRQQTSGYKKRYKVTRLEQYFDDRKSAESARDKYNDKLIDDKRKRTHEFPDTIEWYDFDGTEVQNQLLWWHDSGSWLYAHGYDDWVTEELFDDCDFEYVYEDMHSTKDFFNVLFRKQRFMRYYVSKNNKEKTWKLYERV